jgi:hypothetical protein
LHPTLCALTQMVEETPVPLIGLATVMLLARADCDTASPDAAERKMKAVWRATCRHAGAKIPRKDMSLLNLER